ncbi:hypothetical protein DAEQUDRAFT_167310 [Daedalea quercina L-15889]|uniref:Uncharacterized protein n=1 Tax=Daedalea quercina L-15889 TaxID=1314783 RepID=A0A165RIX6_9APHY|nr:hypothetical protein DAEQUDRAFT_167310 [Daedalea quercina L-15889]
MPKRSRKALTAIKNLGVYARSKKGKEAANASPSSCEHSGTGRHPPSFLEAYEIAQKRIADLANHRERVLAEISQPSTVATIARSELRRETAVQSDTLSSATASEAHGPQAPSQSLPQADLSGTGTRTSARLRSRPSDATSQKALGKRKATTEEMPPSQAAPVICSDETDELVAQRRRVSDFADGLIQAGNALKEQARTADAAWISEIINHANLPAFAEGLHSVLTSARPHPA